MDMDLHSSFTKCFSFDNVVPTGREISMKSGLIFLYCSVDMNNGDATSDFMILW